MMDLLKRLINVRSTSDKGELELVKILADEFAKAGLKSHIDGWDGDRANLTLRIGGNASRPGLMFSSHTDVVPPGESAWNSEPFAATQVGSRIYGRGAADMKAGIAACAAAIMDAAQSGETFKGDLIFSAAAGEETDSCGAKRFLENHKLPALAGIVVTEPTDLKLVACHRGIFWLRIRCFGHTAHASMPHLGRNAVMDATSVIKRLCDLEFGQAAHPRLGANCLSVTTIHGGKATNVIPDLCEFTVDIRTLPGQDHAGILAKVQAELEELRSADPAFKADVEIVRDCGALDTDEHCRFVRDLCRIVGQASPSSVSYTTDGPIFTVLGAPIVIFGPGLPSQCHVPNEYVEIEQVKEARLVYGRIIREMLL